MIVTDGRAKEETKKCKARARGGSCSTIQKGQYSFRSQPKLIGEQTVVLSRLGDEDEVNEKVESNDGEEDWKRLGVP